MVDRGAWCVMRRGLLSSEGQDRTTGNGAFTHFTRLYSLLHPTCLILPAFSFSVSPHTLTRAHTYTCARACLESGPRVKQTAVLCKKRKSEMSLVRFSVTVSLSFGFGFGVSLFFYTIRFSCPAPALADEKAKGSRRGEVAGYLGNDCLSPSTSFECGVGDVS